MSRRAALLALALASAAGTRAGAAALPEVVDEPALQRTVVAARERFLARQPFGRFDVAVLVEGRDGRWRRAAVDGDHRVYPASCVKLAYLAGAIHWCTEHGRAPDCLDADVRPMIVNSDNVATGRVVDALSARANVPWPAADARDAPPSPALTRGESHPDADIPAAELPPDWEAWLGQRRYTERFLESQGLLAGQRLLHKTYPTNSGESPSGYERLAILVHGRNAMSADGAARLLLALETGAVVREGRDYARSLLRRSRWSGHAAFGGGVPPGVLLEAKIGDAYDTLEEIAWLEPPGGPRIALAGFSNGYDQNEPNPWDVGRLNSFSDELLAGLAATDVPGVARLVLPWSTYATAAPAAGWQRVAARGAFREGSALGSATPGARYEWRIPVPRPGRYEVATWFADGPAQSGAARYELVGNAVPAYYDQRRWGSRWLPLGEVEVEGGELIVRLTSDAEEGLLVADTLRVTAVPARSPASRARAARGSAGTGPVRPRGP